MTAQYHLVAHPDLRDELRRLHVTAQRDPTGLAAQQIDAARKGMAALRDGREADFDGKRLSYTQHDLRDCAELKIPVVEELTRRGRPMGPSHRLTYREYDGPSSGDLPVREVIAFAPRRDGRAFEVTAERLGRSKGVPLAELDHLPTPISPNQRITPARQPLPPDLAKTIQAALTGTPSLKGAVKAPATDQHRPRPGPQNPDRPRDR